MSRPELIAIGSSSGGTDPLRAILARVGADTPPVVVVQHMTKEVLPSFVQQLRDRDRVPAREVTGATVLGPGAVWFAPGDRHVVVRRATQGLLAVPSDQVRRSFHRPSIDVLLESVARVVGPQAVGLLLSGMGSDGAQGLLALHEAGARTFAQDERSSAVFGIADAACRLGARPRLLPPAALAEVVASWSTAQGAHDAAR